MNNQSVPSIEFALPNDQGYQQAVCCSALVVVNNANEIFEDMAGGNIDRIISLFTNVKALEEDLSVDTVGTFSLIAKNLEQAKDSDDDMAVFEHLIETVFPLICSTYDVTNEEVLEDVKRAIDHYSDIWITNWLA